MSRKILETIIPLLAMNFQKDLIEIISHGLTDEQNDEMLDAMVEELFPVVREIFEEMSADTIAHYKDLQDMHLLKMKTAESIN